MICPILSQSSRDAEGNVSWDHHECIENSCTFWATEIEDCGIRASGLVVIQRARAALSDAEGEAPAGEPLFTGPRATLDENALRPVLDALEGWATESRENGLRLLEGVAALEEPIKAGSRRIEVGLDSLRESMATSASAEGPIARVEERLDGLRRGLESGFDQNREPVADLNRAFERMNEMLVGLRGQMDDMAARQRDLGDLEGKIGGLDRSIQSQVGGAVERTLETVQQCLTRVAALEEGRQDVRAIGARLDRLDGTLNRIVEGVTGSMQSHEDLAASLTREAERRAEEQRRHAIEEAASLNARGVALYYRGALQGAEAAFRGAIEKNAGLAEAHNNLGLVLTRQGKEQEAEASFRKALELDPDLFEATSNLGFLQHRSGEFEKAVELFRRSTTGAKDSSLAWTNLGNACYQLQRYTQAVQAWRRAIEQDPLNESARRALAMFQQQGASDPS